MSKQDWQLTYDNSCQYVKKIDDDTFKLIELREVGDFDNPSYWVYSKTIRINDYTEEEILEEVNFAYTSLQEIKDVYDNDYKQVVAECIFENLSIDEMAFFKEVRFRVDASNFIHNYIENN